MDIELNRIGHLTMISAQLGSVDLALPTWLDESGSMRSVRSGSICPLAAIRVPWQATSRVLGAVFGDRPRPPGAETYGAARW